MMKAITSIEPDALEGLGRSVGTDDFHAASLAVIAALVPRDMEWIVVYHRRKRPLVLHFELAERPSVEVDRDRVLALYESGFYRFDPFFRHWRADGVPGVVGMHELVGQSDSSSSYLADFMPVTRMADDVAVLLPNGPDQCVVLAVERAARFSAGELRTLRAVYPLLAGLNEAHLRIAGAQVHREAREDAAAPLDFDAAVASFLSGGLTPRERDIVRLVLGGFPTAAIADRLGISPGTVRNHRKRLYAKLDITSERELFSLFLGYLADAEPSELV
jgi:RNA polymerase sigma factor (sigma-70 family)